MEPWLSRSDFQRYIGTSEIPASFDVLKLTATLNEVIEGWLSDLLLPAYILTYRDLFTTYADIYPYDAYPTDPETLLTETQFRNGKTLKQFLAYAVWSIYVKKSNAINTDTGIVAKLNPDSERISDRQRTELSNYYQGLAERKALDLQRLFAEPDTCAPAYVGSGQPIIRKAQRRSPSRLGN